MNSVTETTQKRGRVIGYWDRERNSVEDWGKQQQQKNGVGKLSSVQPRRGIDFAAMVKHEACYVRREFGDGRRIDGVDRTERDAVLEMVYQLEERREMVNDVVVGEV